MGRGANLLLNVPPNREGRLNPEDMASLKDFGDYRRATFGKNVAAAARVYASLRALIDGRSETYWAAEVLKPEAVFDFSQPVTFQVVRLSEAIRFGQRIDSVALERWNSGAWEEVAKATSIGPRRLIRLERPVSASRLRLRVTAAAANPVLSEFALFAE